MGVVIATGMFEIAIWAAGTSTVALKVAFSPGSSQQEATAAPPRLKICRQRPPLAGRSVIVHGEEAHRRLGDRPLIGDR